MNGHAIRLMCTRCNATMLTWLIGIKHRVQLWLMRALFVWQLNVTHPILLQPRSACHRKLVLLAGNRNLKWVNTWTPMAQLRHNDLIYSNTIAGVSMILGVIPCIWLCGFKNVIFFLLHFLQLHCLITKEETQESLQLFRSFDHLNDEAKSVFYMQN